jgi:2-polyprenyl-3-methyl-5-hydroxy-6-metoxy-1,4-benzoquinol methylase
MTPEQKAYGWRDPDACQGHDCLLPPLQEILTRRLGKRARVLDLGCGNGAVTAHLAARGYDVVGVDAAADGIELARRAHPGLRFEVASVYDDGLEGALAAPFDAVISLEVVEHLFYPKKLFEQARRLLRPGGALVVSTPYHGYVKNLAISLAGGWDKHFGVSWDGGHIKFFSRGSLEKMAAEAGFRELRFRGAGRVPYLWKSIVLEASA